MSKIIKVKVSDRLHAKLVAMANKAGMKRSSIYRKALAEATKGRV